MSCLLNCANNILAKHLQIYTLSIVLYGICISESKLLFYYLCFCENLFKLFSAVTFIFWI